LSAYLAGVDFWRPRRQNGHTRWRQKCHWRNAPAAKRATGGEMRRLRVVAGVSAASGVPSCCIRLHNLKSTK
jgi:hypothetical protein